MKAVFLGPPGVGKGTQAAQVSQRHGWAHVSTGDMLREAVAAKSPVGLEAKKYMDAGGLVPDEVVIRIVEQRLSRPDCGRGVILDGFPRTVAQAEALEKALENGGLDAVIFVNAGDDVLIRRLSGRRVCRACGAVFHVETMAPKNKGLCDKCGGELYQRDDDREQTIRERLRVYKRQTAALIDYYKVRDLLVEVAGDREIREVQAAIEKALTERART